MKTKIKRLAQFLFDNAEMIEKELTKSDKYRTLAIDFHAFKSLGHHHQQVELKLYDEIGGHHFLTDNDICIEEFELICRQLDKKAGLIPSSKPIEVREKL